jgi:perosamine synthetase
MRLALLGGEPLRTNDFTMEMPQISQDDMDAVAACLRERCLSIFSSPRVREFEAAFAEHTGTRHAVAVTSGTAALQSALCGASIGPGDEVIVPVYTYAATINAILIQGALPVFVDVDPSTFLLDGEQTREIEDAISKRTRAIMVVDLFGNPLPRKKIVELAVKHDLRVIEDCAQSTGATIHGQRVGSFDIGCHSFGEIKNMTAAEGGMVTTNDDEVARRARLLRHSGEVWRQTRDTTIGSSPGILTEMINGIDYEFVGTNFRMNALQAALGASQLRRLDQFNEERRRIALIYSESLAGVLKPMTVHAEGRAVYNRYPVLLDETLPLSREAFIAALIAEGVPAGVYYPIPFNATKVIREKIGLGRSSFPFDYGRGEDIGSTRAYPGAARACARHVLLPCYPGIPEKEVREVAEACAKILRAAAEPRIAAAIEIAAQKARASYFGQFFTAAS